MRAPATALKRVADVVIAIGVGNVDRRQLRSIASAPVASNTFEIEDFNQLNEFTSRISTTVCFGTQTNLLEDL